MHVMLDLETWGTRPGSALRSIGAVTFGLNATSVGARFYRNIDKESCLLAGLTVDTETVSWWLKQAPEAVAYLGKHFGVPPRVAAGIVDGSLPDGELPMPELGVNMRLCIENALNWQAAQEALAIAA